MTLLSKASVSLDNGLEIDIKLFVEQEQPCYDPPWHHMEIDFYQRRDAAMVSKIIINTISKKEIDKLALQLMKVAAHIIEEE